MNPLTLDEIEKAIESHYRFFAVAAPGVPVQETGDLAELWALADREYAREDWA